jgi:hypothetical protein
MVIDGHSGPIALVPEQIVFDASNMQRTAVTPSTKDALHYSYRTTKFKPDDPILNQDAYLRIELKLKTAELRRLVDILFRR